MKNRKALLFIPIIITAFIINSCKKDNQTTIKALFSYGSWELASVMVTKFTGNTTDTTYQLNTTCNLKQTFTFNSNGTCTYTNFDCIPQTSAPATWSLTANQLYLQTNITCTDTIKKDNSQPFSYAQIYTLGQFSLVLITGDVTPNYSLTQPRTQYTYGFIRRTDN
jgi:hypothetical protein